MSHDCLWWGRWKEGWYSREPSQQAVGLRLTAAREGRGGGAGVIWVKSFLLSGFLFPLSNQSGETQ